jgi:hypothetical protein
VFKVGVTISMFFALVDILKTKHFFPTYGCGRIMKSDKMHMNYVISYMLSEVGLDCLDHFIGNWIRSLIFIAQKTEQMMESLLMELRTKQVKFDPLISWVDTY